MKRRRRILAAVVCTSLLGATWVVVRAPREPEPAPLVVNDVTQLNPIRVAAVIVPTETAQIVEAVARAEGAVSIGGARHSMGGQVASPGSLHIDMRQFNRVLAYSPTDRRITVQAGATWRHLQERIDPDNLSIAIMQSYADFTVGGSLSVNVHGRYVGLGPIVLSVVSFRIVLADGSIVEATPEVNRDVFYGAIGGYGGLGVITDVTLQLAENVKVKQSDRFMPVGEYRTFFLERVRASTNAVFHNGDIYPKAYDTIHAVTYERTDEPVTVPHRLMPRGTYHLDRLAYWVVSEFPFGTQLRRGIVDPMLFRSSRVTWRNYEASYDASALEPASRTRSTYVLQEYFVPVDRFDEFVPAMRGVFQRHDVNVINVSVRHARPDPGSLLAWAKSEVFALVIYYKQGTNASAQKAVGVWTRELIDAALAVDGSYYLPYQLHATEAQFRKAYPRAPEFFALKRRLDPRNTFRNMLWNKYFPAIIDSR